MISACSSYIPQFFHDWWRGRPVYHFFILCNLDIYFLSLQPVRRHFVEDKNAKDLLKRVKVMSSLWFRLQLFIGQCSFLGSSFLFWNSTQVISGLQAYKVTKWDVKRLAQTSQFFLVDEGSTHIITFGGWRISTLMGSCFFGLMFLSVVYNPFRITFLLWKMISMSKELDCPNFSFELCYAM